MTISPPGQIFVNRQKLEAVPHFFVASDRWWVRRALAGLLLSHYPRIRLDSGRQPPARLAGPQSCIVITDAPALATAAYPLAVLLGDDGVSGWQQDENAVLAAIDLVLGHAAQQLDVSKPLPLRRTGNSFGGLTRRQQDVLACLAQGRSNATIAKVLGMSENTVRIHVSAILKALGMDNRTQAALWANNQSNNGTETIAQAS